MVGSGHSSSGMILGQGVKSLRSRCLPREELSLPDWAGSPSPQGEAGLRVRRRASLLCSQRALPATALPSVTARSKLAPRSVGWNLSPLLSNW